MTPMTQDNHLKIPSDQKIFIERGTLSVKLKYHAQLKGYLVTLSPNIAHITCYPISRLSGQISNIQYLGCLDKYPISGLSGPLLCFMDPAVWPLPISTKTLSNKALVTLCKNMSKNTLAKNDFSLKTTPMWATLFEHLPEIRNKDFSNYSGAGRPRVNLPQILSDN